MKTGFKLITSALLLLAAPGMAAWHIVEGFEGATFPPVGWTVADLAVPEANWVRSDSSYQAHTGNHAAYITYSPSGAGPCNDWLITPQIVVQPNDSIYFWFRSDYIGWSPDDTYLNISTTNNLPASFTTTLWHLWEGGGYSQTYTQQGVSLSSYAGHQVYLAFQNINDYGDGVLIDDVMVGQGPVGVSGEPSQAGSCTLSLLPSRPNPARGKTFFGFTLPKAGNYELGVYNFAGQLAHRITGVGSGGLNRVEWNAAVLPAGVYFCRLSSASGTAARRMTVVR